ncbi:DUF4190 domain-containing protein [Leifsonia sp. 2TAF2]|uniref:DUF4190 domain-containing protein n=1 Tax=Leifsonia sp. 2TAF2 TaxID=3233009 RepID=UPI003F96183B
MDESEFVAGQPARPEVPVAQPVERLPFSQLAIWGFVISCVSLFVFGFIGTLGAALSGRGFRAAAQGRARGKGLAIAGMIIGAAGFLFWAVVFVLSHFR